MNPKIKPEVYDLFAGKLPVNNATKSSSSTLSQRPAAVIPSLAIVGTVVAAAATAAVNATSPKRARIESNRMSQANLQKSQLAEEPANRSKILPGIASFFMRRVPSQPEQEYCFTEPSPPPRCFSKSSSCSKGCYSQRSRTAGDSSTTSTTDAYEEERNDNSSNDDDTEEETSTIASLNSSEEDTLEAFEQNTAQARRPTQKGDAASLKQYAYGNTELLLFTYYAM